MFLFYVLSFFKKGDTIQGGTLFKGGHYLRKYGISHQSLGLVSSLSNVETAIYWSKAKTKRSESIFGYIFSQINTVP